MCTLLAKLDGLELTLAMNRDNPKQREHSTYIIEPDKYIYPLVEDDKTWIAATSKGEVYALLNGENDLFGSGKYSRGEIIPKLLRGEWDFNIHNYAPFQLFGYNGKGNMSYFKWDGKHRDMAAYQNKIILASSRFKYSAAKIAYVDENFPKSNQEFKDILATCNPAIYLKEDEAETIASTFIKVTPSGVLFQNASNPLFKDIEEWNVARD